jgi:hypothetical protein
MSSTVGQSRARSASILMLIFIVVALGLAFVLWVGWCVDCDSSNVGNVPGVRFAPLAGIVGCAMLIACLSSPVRHKVHDVTSAKLTSLSVSLLSSMLFVGILGMSVFATAAIKPCLLCSMFWGCLGASALTAYFARLQGSWLVLVSVLAGLTCSGIILLTGFKYTVRGVVAPYLSLTGLPAGSSWPDAATVGNATYYLVLSDCTPCVQKVGLDAAKILERAFQQKFAVITLAGTDVALVEAKGRTRAIDARVFKLLKLSTNAPPHVFEVRSNRVVRSAQAYLYVQELERKQKKVQDERT